MQTVNWGTVWLIVVGGFISILLVRCVVEWVRKPPSFSKKMSIIADKLSKSGLYGNITTRVRIPDEWVEFVDTYGHPEVRVSVHEVDNEKLVIVSCDMSNEVITLFREALSSNGSGLHFRSI